MKRIVSFLFLFALLILFSNCKKNDDDKPAAPSYPDYRVTQVIESYSGFFRTKYVFEYDGDQASKLKIFTEEDSGWVEDKTERTFEYDVNKITYLVAGNPFVTWRFNDDGTYQSVEHYSSGSNHGLLFDFSHTDGNLTGLDKSEYGANGCPADQYNITRRETATYGGSSLQTAKEQSYSCATEDFTDQKKSTVEYSNGKISRIESDVYDEATSKWIKETQVFEYNSKGLIKKVGYYKFKEKGNYLNRSKFYTFLYNSDNLVENVEVGYGSGVKRFEFTYEHKTGNYIDLVHFLDYNLTELTWTPLTLTIKPILKD